MLQNDEITDNTSLIGILRAVEIIEYTSCALMRHYYNIVNPTGEELQLVASLLPPQHAILVNCNISLFCQLSVVLCCFTSSTRIIG
jgi:hypothetical protein